MLECIGGILIGGAFLGISKVTRGQIGIGDGLILCVTGLGLGIAKGMEMLLYGLLLAALFSAILLVRKVANRKMTIPFIPFLFVGYLITILI